MVGIPLGRLFETACGKEKKKRKDKKQKEEGIERDRMALARKKDKKTGALRSF